MKKQINRIEKEYIQSEEANIKEHNEIKEMLLSVDGKEINKRTFTTKVLGKYEFINEFGMFHIKGNTKHLIGYRDTLFVNAANFDESDASCGYAAEKRIENIKAIDKEKVIKIYSKIKKHYEGLKAAFGEIETNDLDAFHYSPYYSIIKEIQGKDNENGNGIQLSDFNSIRTIK